MEMFEQKDAPRFEYRVRKVSVDDWEKLRDIRTRAISDSPQAFADTLPQTLARPDDEWRRWSSGNTYVVELSNIFVASVSLIKHPDHGEYVVGVWTDPLYRKRGLSKRLFEQVFTDARLRGVTKISLHVNREQNGAVQLYNDLGFHIVGDVGQKRMGDDKFHDEYFMEKDLS